MWHVSSRSDVATFRTAIHLLPTYLFTATGVVVSSICQFAAESTLTTASSAKTVYRIKMPLGCRLVRTRIIACVRWTCIFVGKKGEADTWERTCIRHPVDNGRVQCSRLLDATNSTQQGRHTAAMRAIATVTVGTCFFMSRWPCYIVNCYFTTKRGLQMSTNSVYQSCRIAEAALAPHDALLVLLHFGGIAAVLCLTAYSWTSR